MHRMGIDRELRVDAVADARRIGSRKRYNEATRLSESKRRSLAAIGYRLVIPAKAGIQCL